MPWSISSTLLFAQALSVCPYCLACPNSTFVITTEMELCRFTHMIVAFHPIGLRVVEPTFRLTVTDSDSGVIMLLTTQ